MGRTTGYWRPKEYAKDAESTARGLVSQWMGSPGHQKNVLAERYHRIGVGVAVSVETKPESTDAERPWGWNKGCGPWDATVRAQFR